MAAILVGFLGITLEEVGQAVGLSLVYAGTARLFSLIGRPKADPTTSNAIVMADINRVWTDLQKVQASTQEIENQVVELRLNEKYDTIQVYVDNINSLHDQYWATLTAYKRLYDDGNPINGTKMIAAITRRKQLSESVSDGNDGIYNDLSHINTFLVGQGDQSLLALAALQSLEDGDDVFRHFVKMKSIMLHFHSIQYKALYLLNSVAADPETDFIDGPEIIQKVEDNMKVQEEFFNKQVNQNVQDLASFFANNPKGRYPCLFQTGAGYDISEANSAFHYNDPKRKTSIAHRSLRWYLEPVSSLKNPTVDQVYNFHLIEGVTGDYVGITNSAYGVVNSGELFSEWNILPQKGGQFRLQYNNSQYDNSNFAGAVLSLNTIGQTLYYDSKLDPDNANQLFQITPFQGALFGSTLTTDESMAFNTSLVSDNKKYEFTLGAQGTLAIYLAENKRVHWQPNFTRKPEGVGKVMFSEDGSLQAFDVKGNVYWSNGVKGDIFEHATDITKLTDDGVLQTMRKDGTVLWSSGE